MFYIEINISTKLDLFVNCISAALWMMGLNMLVVNDFYCVVFYCFGAAAYKYADGKKINDKRVVVDVERGRTVKGWRPRRLGKF